MPKLATTRAERLALTLADLDRLDPGIRRKMLGGRIALTPVRADDGIIRADGVIIPFVCPLLESAMIADVLRFQDKQAGNRVTGVWLDRGRGWRKLASDAVLTVKVNETFILNPAVFDDAFDAPPPDMDVTI